MIVLLYRVTFKVSYNGSHFELGITTDMSMRKMIPEPANQTKVSLACCILILFKLVCPRWEWGEGLFDCSWSEHNQDFSVTASGDGSLQIWDLKNPKVTYYFKYFVL